MKLRTKINAYGDIMYYIFWLILMFGKGLNLAGEEPLMQILTYAAIILVLFGAYTIRFTQRELRLCVFLVSVGVMVMLTAKKATILLTVLAICTAKRQNMREILKIGFWVRMPMFLATIYLATHGMLANSLKYEWRAGVRLMRYGLGVGHPNVAHLTLFILVTMYIYLYYEKIGIKSVIAISAINFWLYRYTITRTGFILTLLLPLTVIFVKTKHPAFRLLKRAILCFFVHSYFLMGIGSLMLSIIYNNKHVRAVTDKYLGSRMACANDFLQKYPFSLFGHYIDGEGVPLDNAYIYTYVAYGSITFFLLIYGYTKLLKQYKSQNRIKEILILGFFAIYGFSENFITNVIMNYSLLFIIDMIFDRSGRKILTEDRAINYEVGAEKECNKEYRNWGVE